MSANMSEKRAHVAAQLLDGYDDEALCRYYLTESSDEHVTRMRQRLEAHEDAEAEISRLTDERDELEEKLNHAQERDPELEERAEKQAEALEKIEQVLDDELMTGAEKLARIRAEAAACTSD